LRAWQNAGLSERVAMRNRKKKGPTDDTGKKPEPKTDEKPFELAEETKDDPAKEASKPKPTRLRRCAWTCFKIILFLAALAVMVLLFLIFALPRIVSEMQVYIHSFQKYP